MCAEQVDWAEGVMTHRDAWSNARKDVDCVAYLRAGRGRQLLPSAFATFSSRLLRPLSVAKAALCAVKWLPSSGQKESPGIFAIYHATGRDLVGAVMTSDMTEGRLAEDCSPLRLAASDHTKGASKHAETALQVDYRPQSRKSRPAHEEDAPSENYPAESSGRICRRVFFSVESSMQNKNFLLVSMVRLV